jgi:hypothetical protein
LGPQNPNLAKKTKKCPRDQNGEGQKNEPHRAWHPSHARWGYLESPAKTYPPVTLLLENMLTPCSFSDQQHIRFSAEFVIPNCPLYCPPGRIVCAWLKRYNPGAQLCGLPRFLVCPSLGIPLSLSSPLSWPIHINRWNRVFDRAFGL